MGDDHPDGWMGAPFAKIHSEQKIYHFIALQVGRCCQVGLEIISFLTPLLLKTHPSYLPIATRQCSDLMEVGVVDGDQVRTAGNDVASDLSLTLFPEF